MTAESSDPSQASAPAKRLVPPLTPEQLAGLFYLTPKQLARLLQVSVKTIYRWVEQEPTMPALRSGAVRFQKDRILAWLRSREQGPGRRRQSQKQMLSPADGTAGRNSGAPLRIVGEPAPAPCAHPCAPEAS